MALLTRVNLTPTEQRLCEKAAGGQLLDLRSGQAKNDDPAEGICWAGALQSRGMALTTYLAQALVPAPPPRVRLPTASSNRAHEELHETKGSSIRSKTASCLSKAASCEDIAAICCRWALTVWATAANCAADRAPGGLGSAGSDSADGVAPARLRDRSVKPRSWATNSSIDRPTNPGCPLSRSELLSVSFSAIPSPPYSMAASSVALAATDEVAESAAGTPPGPNARDGHPSPPATIDQSSPTSPLAVWKDSSIAQRSPSTP
jgi:hypothetical protein